MRDMIDLTLEPDVPRRAVLCAVQTPDVDDTTFRESLAELGHLGRTLGLSIAGELTQRRAGYSAAAYFGPGKVLELKQLVEADPQPTVVLVDHELSLPEIVARGHPIETVRRVERMLYLAEYKRRQAAPGVKISERNFGRDRRYPITNKFREPIG